MVDYVVSGQSTQPLQVGSGTGLVEEGASLNVAQGDAIAQTGIAVEPSEWDVDGSVTANDGAAMHFTTESVSIEVSETGKLISTGDSALQITALAGSTIVNAGLITGLENAVFASGGNATVENNGTISAGDTGVWLSARFSASLINTGDISGNDTGAKLSVSQSGTVNVTNQGNIVGATASVSLSNSVGDIRLTNEGILDGDVILRVGNASSGSVINSGTILGGIDGSSGSGRTLTVTNSGLVFGDVTNVREYLGEDGEIAGVVSATADWDARIFTGAGDDTIIGNVRDDLLSGGEGNDVIDGGDGTDTAQFKGTASDYTFTRIADGIVSAFNDTYGYDTLINIERIAFTGETETYAIEDLISGTHDDPTATQHLTGTDGTDVFIIDGNAADSSWGPTDDGTGVVVWNANGYDILRDFEIIRFNDVDVALTSEDETYEDVPNVTQYLTGRGDNDTFVIDGVAADYNWGATEDGQGIVVWGNTGYDILFDFEVIQFNDQTVSIGASQANTVADIAGQTQHLTGSTDASVTDRFVISGSSSDYGWGATDDGTGVVVWSGDDYDILREFEEIQFDDTTIDISDGFGLGA